MQWRQFCRAAAICSREKESPKGENQYEKTRDCPAAGGPAAVPVHGRSGGIRRRCRDDGGTCRRTGKLQCARRGEAGCFLLADQRLRPVQRPDPVRRRLQRHRSHHLVEHHLERGRHAGNGEAVQEHQGTGPLRRAGSEWLHHPDQAQLRLRHLSGGPERQGLHRADLCERQVQHQAGQRGFRRLRQSGRTVCG